ncbi:MAG: DUF354 domain-containing protein [Candidatus Delongbacteria bacterium]|nr:DUF354 domain-containing protein [Candidatus Delongbacteria bacterium]
MKKAVWIDIDNSPHVQIFEHIIKELEKEYTVYVTAREYNQTVGLLDLKGIKYKLVGKHPGKNLFNKYFFNLLRTFRLFIWGIGKNISLSVTHGARAGILASKLLGVRSIVMFDYEHVESFLFKKMSKYLLATSYLKKDDLLKLEFPEDKLNFYPGLKENIYLPFFKEDPSIIERLGINTEKIVILLRPASEVSHYNLDVSYDLIGELFELLVSRDDVQVVFVPRYDSQKEKYAEYINNPKKNVIVPKQVEEGLNLVFHSDLVISGGGTMNREAAAMNTPVYSIFQGKRPGVDTNLEKQGKLSFITSKEDLEKIVFKKKDISDIDMNRDAFESVLSFIKERV